MGETKRSQPPIRHPGLVALVVASLTFGLVAVAFYTALEATPYETTDSAGRTMGFNDPFSAGHYEIIVSKVSIGRMLTGIGPYELLLIGAQLTMAVLLWRPARPRWIIGFCALQPAVFFWGVFGLLYLPFDLPTLSGKDREGFIDMPWVELISHGAWLYVCLVIVIRVWLVGRRQRKV
jgi:hypothetical protein